MKLLGGLVMLSGSQALDRNFNPDRPRVAGRCQQTSSVKDLLPEQVRFDPALYEKVDRKLFSRGRMDTAIPDDGDNFFSCGQNAMSLVVVTDKYAGLSTLEEGDFSLMDTNCNATTSHVKWECVQDADGNDVELLVAHIPLDECGTAASYDETNDKLVFTNTVKNGAYSIVGQDQDTHNGITKDSIVDFGVTCRYDAVYDDVDIETNAQHASLDEAIRDDDNTGFQLAIDFKKANSTAPAQADGLPKFIDFAGNVEYTVGDPAYFTVGMEHPNKAVYLQLEDCIMMSGLTPLMNYTIVEDQCGDIFTNTKVIDGYEHGTSLVSFTMFEFVSDIPKTTAQTNHLKCSVKLCLVDDPCESTADQC